jgi:plastocyanin
LLSQTTSSHAYGIGVITLVIGLSVGIGYYQMFYLPEQSAKPAVSEHILHPVSQTEIKMIPGSASEEQQDNFIPKLVNIQLGIDNHVIWTNDDSVAHTVTPDHRAEDSYSGEFGSPGVVLPGESYEFLFTEDHEFSYHCQPHPWMTGTIIVTKQRF